MNLGQSYLPNIKKLRPDVVMLCSNDGWDVRALKEARSLSAAGLSVVIVGRRRYHTELARFTDEFGIDIINVPMLNDPTTMRLHLESGLWLRLNLFEKILTSILLWIFRVTELKIRPKKVPPPVSGRVLASLEKRKRILSNRASKQIRSKNKITPNNKSLFLESVRRNYSRVVRPIAEATREAPVLFFVARIFAWVLKLVAIVLALPFVIILFPFWILYTGIVWFYRRAKRFIPQPPNLLGRLHNRFISERTKFGRNIFRYSRYFLYTIEYGETVARLNPKIIHAHDLYTLQSARRIGNWINAKVIYDAHELESDRRAGTGKRMKNWIIKQEKKYASRADACVTVSHAIGEELMQECRLKAKPTVIFNSPVIKDMPFEMEGRDIRSDLGLEKGEGLFVFVGKVYEIYGGNQKIATIIKALSLCPEFHLAIVGPTSQEAERQINNLVAELGSEGRIHLVPPIPAEAIVHYIKTADVSVYFMWPDTRNIDLTIPNKLFEFSLSGLPLVVSSLHSTRWFCEQFNNAIPVEENSAEAIAQACRQAYAAREKLRPEPEMLQSMLKNYSWGAQSQKLWNLYKELLNPVVSSPSQ